MRNFIGLIAALLFLHGCAIFQPKEKPLTEMNRIIEMSKGPCYGNCPVFTLKIYDEGFVSYEGEQFTERLGVYSKRLAKDKFEALKTAFKEANLWQYQNVYRGNIPDLQTVTITYYEEGDLKTIVGKDGRPEAILKLQDMLDDIANDYEDWKLVERKTFGLPNHVIANELIVQLDEEVDAKEWAISYSRQEMKVKKRISPHGNYWLFTYNTSRMQPNEMLETVRRDRSVLSAEFNKNITTRGGGR